MSYSEYTPHRNGASQPGPYRNGFPADPSYPPHALPQQPHRPQPPRAPQHLQQPPVLRTRGPNPQRSEPAPREGDGPADAYPPSQIQSAVRVEMRDPRMSPEAYRGSPSPSLQYDKNSFSPTSPTSPRLIKISTPSPEPRPSPTPPLVVKRGSPHHAQLISFKHDPLPQSLRQQAEEEAHKTAASRGGAEPLQMPSPPAASALNIKIGNGASSAATSTSSLATRKDSTALQFGSLGTDSAKPQPQRRQYTEGEGGKPPKLDIEQFEAIRRSAAAQVLDPNVQMEYAKTLAEAAEVLASRYTDPATPSTMHVDVKIEQRNREFWTREALNITRKLALKVMFPEALFFLGCSYSTGTMGLEVDAAKAFELYTRAAKAEHPQASYRVAVCYEIGVGARRDLDKALTWYKRAAQLGDVSSMYKLGMLALDGDQPEEGLAWLLRASDLGEASSPHALHELGLIYEGSERCERRKSSTGHARRQSDQQHRRSASVGSVKSTSSRGSLLPRDPAKALGFFYRAAKLGYAPSQFRMGHAYEYRELGCELDPQKSISWYTAAAQQGDADAELALSGWHWTGALGVLRKSETEAFLWAERAADKGLGKAFFCLGHFYEYGIGVRAAPDRAKYWFSRAAEQKHPKAAGRLKLLERSALAQPSEYAM